MTTIKIDWRLKINLRANIFLLQKNIYIIKVLLKNAKLKSKEIKKSGDLIKGKYFKVF